MTVVEVADRLMRLRGLNIGRRLVWLPGLGFLLAVAFMHCPGAAQPRSMLQGPAGPGRMQFTIADLDGDRKPDLASVEIEKQYAGSTSYAIRLQFGAGGDSRVDVNGPLGGLHVAVRDVNGDDRLDLVLTSVMDRRVVQVLLNDGHGKFAAAAAGSFSSIEIVSEFGLRERGSNPSDRMVLAATRTTFDADVVGRRENYTDDLNSPFGLHNKPIVSCHESGPQSGRSPPSLLVVS
jgi:hypothetical protein